MSLLERVEKAQQPAPDPDAPVAPPPPPAPPTPARIAAREDLMRAIRLRLQAEVMSVFDTLLDIADPAELIVKVEALVDRVIKADGFIVTHDESARLVTEVVGEVAGLGPLDPLLKDETVTEIMVNGPNHLYIERAGKILRVDTVFLNDEHVLRIIDRIITPLGRRIDQTSPRVDARLPDGSRVNAVIEPLSLIGPVITVRKFPARPITVDDMISFGTATAEMFDFLKACVEARLNVFVSGGTGSGKTTTLNVLSSFIPEDERIVTVEDAAELQLRQTHVVSLESRPPNLEGTGEITIRALLRNAMHMRPDRIIVGECRSGEALDMLQAMTTGHDGSLSTGHANTPPDMLRRLETMVLMTGYDLPLRAIREQIASAVDLIVHTARLKDGTRKIVNITEVYGIEDDEILTQDIFTYEQTGVRDGKIEGELKPTGIRPTFMGVFKASGVELPPGEFGIPPKDPSTAARLGKGRWADGDSRPGIDSKLPPIGFGRAVKAGGMVYVTSMGPVDPDTGLIVAGGIKEQARQCLANLKARLEKEGSSLDKVVWANWSLRDPLEFDTFNEEWARAFPGDTPVGQGTVMPQLQRRAGFRISIGVIAEA
jgi:pilus assembly protein CpaF